MTISVGTHLRTPLGAPASKARRRATGAVTSQYGGLGLSPRERNRVRILAPVFYLDDLVEVGMGER
jgi:hypothetical protein